MMLQNVDKSQIILMPTTNSAYGSGDENNFCTEETPLNPISSYAIAKVAAHHNVRLYREAYGLHASSGILFNHESYLRGEFFVTKKITKWISSYQHNRGSVEPLRLGNLKAYRDWGFAGDYVKAMHLMLQQDNPDDYVVATGDTHTVEDFLDEAFKLVGVSDWSKLVIIDESLKRPCEVPMLRGDSTKARDVLGWKPTVNFQELIKKMVFNHVF
jgi:GDPmannose 4,6-dehydratase